MQSIDILRLVIPQISKYNLAATPVNYTIWYEYYRSQNKHLKQVIDDRINQEKAITNELFETFYETYISDLDSKTFKQAHAELLQLISRLSESTNTTDSSAATFQDSLQHYANHFNTSKDLYEPEEVIGKLITETQSMLSSLDSMRLEMNESQIKINELKTKLDQVTAETLTDVLTGISNRKGFLKAFKETLSGSQNASPSISLLMLDIDHFKKVNDTHGHIVGDKVIKFISQILAKEIKGQDTAARFGGEEFIVLLPNTKLDDAEKMAQSIRIKIENSRLRHIKSQKLLGQITISIGVTHYLKNEAVESFIDRADAALYESKQKGRNRVTVYNQ